MLTVCTGWNAKGWDEYGRRFAETFDKFWPAQVRLLVIGEDPRELPNASGRWYEFRPLATIPDCVAFLERHTAPEFAGLKRLPQHAWKTKAIQRGYYWKFDARKFCRQCFIPLEAMLWSGPGDYVCWLDGDVFTHSPVPTGAIEELLPAGKHIAYLGRGDKHPEIGFQLYRVGHPAYAFLRAWRDLYATDAVFSIGEWHSAFAWQHVLDLLSKIQPGLAHNLTPRGVGHVWHQSPLRQWTDHLKGDRKGAEKSPEARK